MLTTEAILNMENLKSTLRVLVLTHYVILQLNKSYDFYLIVFLLLHLHFFPPGVVFKLRKQNW